MDNLTHGLCGALVAELWLQAAPMRFRPTRRAVAYGASIAANNLPDLDLVLTGLIDGKLGYLLHHRGHTHTVLGAGVLAALLWAGLRFSLARACSRSEALGLAGLCGLGVVLHLLLDFGNNYGVHPFWPLDSNWYYGDVAYIIEPWWWSVAAACLAASAQSRIARYTLWCVWGLGAVVPLLLPLSLSAGIYASAVAALAALGVGVRWPVFRRSAAARVGCTLGALALFYVAHLGLRGLSSSRLELALDELQAAQGPLETAAVIATPMPASPWCWEFIVVGIQKVPAGTDYVSWIARASALPGTFEVRDCPRTRPNPTVRLGSLPTSQIAGVQWSGEYRVGKAQWKDLVSDCFVRAFLGFARAPYFDPQRRIAGDLRYDSGPDLEFAELELPADGQPCPSGVPGWIWPRKALADALGAGEP